MSSENFTTRPGAAAPFRLIALPSLGPYGRRTTSRVRSSYWGSSFRCAKNTACRPASRRRAAVGEQPAYCRKWLRRKSFTFCSMVHEVLGTRESIPIHAEHLLHADQGEHGFLDAARAGLKSNSRFSRDAVWCRSARYVPRPKTALTTLAIRGMPNSFAGLAPGVFRDGDHPLSSPGSGAGNDVARVNVGRIASIPRNRQ